jgi:SAM-dependent methyltransferase
VIAAVAGTGQSNRAWSDALLRRIDPSFRHRWELYDDIVGGLLAPSATWIDVGCGDNAMVTDYGDRAGRAVGVDRMVPVPGTRRFVRASLAALPMASASADLVTLRFVAEHLAAASDLAEAARVLKPGGRMIVLTTNTLSPLIALPRLLPFGVKNWIIRTIFKVREDDVLPTYHALNTPDAYRRGPAGLALERLWLVSDLNYTRRWMFLVLLAWHLFTRMPGCEDLRTNLLAVCRKGGA